MSSTQVISWALTSIAILSGLIAAAARTPPEDALGNWTKWAQELGIHKLPGWLKSRSFREKAASWAGRAFVTSILMAILSWSNWLSTPDTSKSDAPRVSRAAQTTGPAADLSPPPEHVLSDIPKDGIPLADATVHGWLIPAHDPTPPNPCDRASLGPDAAILLMGTNAIASNGYGTFIPLEIKQCEAIVMDRTPEGVLFGMQLIDADDNRVVTIRNNEIEALNGENYHARQSQDRASITIENKNNVELFYARFINKNVIRVRGLFGCDPHATVAIEDNQPIGGIFLSNNCFANSRVGMHIN